jgi:hypothetical protein
MNLAEVPPSTQSMRRSVRDSMWRGVRVGRGWIVMEGCM